MSDMVIMASHSRPIFQGEPAKVAAWLGIHKDSLQGYWVFTERTREFLDIPSYLKGVRHRPVATEPLAGLQGGWRWAYNIALCTEFRTLRMWGTDVGNLADLLGGNPGFRTGDYLVRTSDRELRVVPEREFAAEYIVIPFGLQEKAGV